MPKGQRTEFLFNYEDMARLTGISEETLMQHRVRKNFDPGNLESIVLFCARHGVPELRHRLLVYATERLLPEKAGPRAKIKRPKSA